jgi:hypothetical protein
MFTKKFIIGIMTSGLILISGCNKDGDSNVITVTTGAITDFTALSATGGGTVNATGNLSVTERGVCWGYGVNPTTGAHKTIDGMGPGSFASILTGLDAGTFYYVRAYAISNGKAYYGKEVTFTSLPASELIKNGNISLPSDKTVAEINSLESWKTDETGPVVGRSQDVDFNPSNFIIWMNDKSKSIYQTVGTVPSAAEYKISFDANFKWVDASVDVTPTIGVIFSAYSGNDPTKRSGIDTVKLYIPTDWYVPVDEWIPMTGSYSLPAGSPFTGQNLVIELKVLFPSNGQNPDSKLGFQFDNISIKQALGK